MVSDNEDARNKHLSSLRWRNWWSIERCIFTIVCFISCVTANRPPQFLTGAQTEIVLRLKEGPDTPVGTLIYRLHGIDPDGDSLTFGIKEQPGSDIIRIENFGTSEANVYLNKELDRETRDEYLIVLTLTDGQLGEGNFITQSLLLLVDDVNDNEPVFKPYQSSIVVREDSAPGIITTVEATDADEGPYGQVVYHLQDFENEEYLFSIATVNGKGVIRLTGQLDYEKSSLHQLRVLAIDRANEEKRKTGTAAILIRVQDVEDQPPEFVMVTPVTRVSEDAPVGSSVLQVRAIDGDRGVNNKIVYSISGAQDIFGIDSYTGIISTRKNLDREGPATNNGAYIVQISAREESQNPYSNEVIQTEVTIIVTDVNDETPTFRSARYVGEINENAQSNTPVTFIGTAVPQVFDYDQGNNGTFKMFIEGDNGIFDITPNKGVNEASFLIRVKDTSKLDYEQMKVVNFTLIAQETVSQNPKYSSAPVTIYVRDINDNFPEFTQSFYEVTVPENSVSGTTVAWVEAFDRDSSLYGSEGIRYTAIGGSIADKLNIDPLSGAIKIKSSQPLFDREQVSRHYLTIEARDDLGHGNRNTAQLIINVGDVNDNAPIFSQKRYEVRLQENKMDFDVPLIVEAHDLDLNGTANSDIRYSIVNTDSIQENFTIDAIKGILKPKYPVDFEKLSSKSVGKLIGNMKSVGLFVEARDRGIPSLSSEVPVIIYIEDENDHAPQFEYSFYQASIPEDLAPGSTVLQVKAFDMDGSSPNNVVVYRIQTGAEDKFILDATSGVIRVAQGASLDPDNMQPKTNMYLLTVIALDGGIGENQKKASVLVNITIKDVNNKPPVLIDPGIIHMKENTPVGKVIHKLKAIDPDEKPILRYKVDRDLSEARNEDGAVVKITEYDFLSAFELNPVDGTLKVSRLIDREKVETIRMMFVVEDLAATKGNQVSSVVLVIIIDDENDNSPIFRKPFYRRAITENSQSGTAILNIVADDVDKNRTISYSLEGSLGKTTDLVHLDRDTGEMVVAGRIDHEQSPWLNMSVRATDSGFPNRSSFVDVFIQVVDENDNNPYFIDSTLSNVSVPEDATVGTKVAVIEARDADSGDFGKITYLLDRLSSQGKFSIDPDTGMLTVNDNLDRETVDYYSLIVEAWDNYQYGYASGESRNAFKQITVTVSDVNDNAPEFDHFPESCVSITEFHEIGDTVLLLKATDADDPETPNGKVKFHIEDGNDLGLFETRYVDTLSARLITTQSLKTLYGNHTLLLRVEDMGNPVRSALATLNICVTDFNDNAPKFISPPHNVTIRIPENATVGSAIITVEAVDDDKGPNAVVHYALKQDLAGNWKTFAINEHTGLIILKKPLNRKKQKVYQLRVEAYDLGIPTPLSSDLDLSIYVRSVNDHQPQFLIDKFTINFTEGQPPGVEQWQLTDTVDQDRDEIDELDDPPSPVCYYIIYGNEKNYFSLEPLSHKVTILKELDREENDTHVLIIKASEDCISAPKVEKFLEFDTHDDTTLRVVVRVNDINDNPPKFIKKIFTGGVTTEADFGTEFMQIKATDADTGINAEMHYFIVSQPQMSLSEGLDNIQMPPFVIDEQSGSVFLNFDPQRGMKGYFDFYVKVNDSGGLEDTARVLIYLLREDQRVRFVMRQNPPQLREKIDIFRDVLGNVTGAIVNVDECKVHENRDGRVDKTRSDLYLHFVNPNDNSIMEVSDVLRLIDENIERLDDLFKNFNVLDTEAAEAEPLRRTSIASDGILWVYMAGTSIFLSLLLFVVTCLCLSQRSRYKRQLKAATISAFGSSDSDFTRTTNVTGRVPNTNIHSTEGSNPMWMQAYENEWYKAEDSISQASERDSLDENVVSNTSQDDFTSNIPCITSPPKEVMIKNTVATFMRNGIQNDLNQNGHCHQNIRIISNNGCNYSEMSNNIQKLNNSLPDSPSKVITTTTVMKKLETTEL